MFFWTKVSLLCAWTEANITFQSISDGFLNLFSILTFEWNNQLYFANISVLIMSEVQININFA